MNYEAGKKSTIHTRPSDKSCLVKEMGIYTKNTNSGDAELRQN